MGFTWLIFSIYCLLVYFSTRAQRWYENISIASYLKFLAFFLFFGILTELFAIIDNMPLPPEDRILFNADPFIDLYLALGFYLAFAIVWYVVYSRINFTHGEVFVIAGTLGILFEQTGKLLLSLNIPGWIYVFLVYGSFQASAIILAEKEMNSLSRKELSIPKKIIVGVVAEFSAFILAAVFLWLLKLPLK